MGTRYLGRPPEAVQLTHLKDGFEVIFNILDSCESGLDHAIEIRNEISSYYLDDFFG
jgi:hypothetical protein